ncbi:hypothetical protein G6F57_016262 [Rhizopus arrhizus]|nr:hypothetical protein G6F57_016262 [Rhizopus arrhizus]
MPRSSAAREGKWYSRPPRVSWASAATDAKVTARTPSRLITLTAASRMRSRLLVLIASFYAIGRALAAADSAAQQARDDRRTDRQHHRDHQQHDLVAAVVRSRGQREPLALPALACHMQGLGEALACQRRHVGRGRQEGAVHRRAQAAQHRHRQQATEFVGDFLHRRGHARTVRRHIIEDGGGRHRDGRAHAKAGDGHAGHHPAQAVREAERNHADTHRACGQATADQRTQADPVQDAAAQQRAGQAAQRRHRDQQARLQRGEARHQLEALGGDQLQAGHREQGEHRRQRAGQERGIAEDREVQQRVRQLLLAPRERRTADDRQQQRAGTERPAPAPTTPDPMGARYRAGLPAPAAAWPRRRPPPPAR